MIGTSLLRNISRPLKLAIASFLFVLVFGYAASFLLLSDATNLTPKGITENYLGNEDSEDEGPLKFRKSKFEMLSTVHTHAFTLGMLFLIMAFLTYNTNLKPGIKTFLMVEPLLSIVLTFGSLILLWLGFEFFKYVALVSGIVMHSSFAAMVGIVFYELVQKPKLL